MKEHWQWHLLPLTVFSGTSVWLPVHYQKTEHSLLVPEIRNIVLGIHLLFFFKINIPERQWRLLQ